MCVRRGADHVAALRRSNRPCSLQAKRRPLIEPHRIYLYPPTQSVIRTTPIQISTQDRTHADTKAHTSARPTNQPTRSHVPATRRHTHATPAPPPPHESLTRSAHHPPQKLRNVKPAQADHPPREQPRQRAAHTFIHAAPTLTHTLCNLQNQLRFPGPPRRGPSTGRHTHTHTRRQKRKRLKGVAEYRLVLACSSWVHVVPLACEHESRVRTLSLRSSQVHDLGMIVWRHVLAIWQVHGRICLAAQGNVDVGKRTCELLPCRMTCLHSMPLR